MPALGPSLGVAPSGTWMWRSFFSRRSFFAFDFWNIFFATVRAAWIDSCITSPREPVFMILPLPADSAASICNSSPPTEVQARPLTCPKEFWSSCWPYLNFSGPKMFLTTLLSISLVALPPSERSLTFFLQTLFISLSKFLTPASRV